MFKLIKTSFAKDDMHGIWQMIYGSWELWYGNWDMWAGKSQYQLAMQ